MISPSPKFSQIRLIVHFRSGLDVFPNDPALQKSKQRFFRLFTVYSKDRHSTELQVLTTSLETLKRTISHMVRHNIYIKSSYIS